MPLHIDLRVMLTYYECKKVRDNYLTIGYIVIRSDYRVIEKSKFILTSDLALINPAPLIVENPAPEYQFILMVDGYNRLHLPY